MALTVVVEVPPRDREVLASWVRASSIRAGPGPRRSLRRPPHPAPARRLALAARLAATVHHRQHRTTLRNLISPPRPRPARPGRTVEEPDRPATRPRPPHQPRSLTRIRRLHNPDRWIRAQSRDIVPAPRAVAEHFYNVADWHEHATGGHFAAWEAPSPLSTRSDRRPCTHDRRRTAGGLEPDPRVARLDVAIAPDCCSHPAAPPSRGRCCPVVRGVLL